MVIQSIELKGHGSYRDYAKVEFPLGIIGILGQYDEDPLQSNGSGKSTLVMAVVYALFGEGEFKVLKELVNVDITDGIMYVKIHFTLNGNNYYVERGMRGGTSYLDFKENGIRKGDSDKIKLTQLEILNVLNMDYGMFTTSGFFEQGGIDKFIDTDPEMLRQYINKVLGIELWRVVSKISKKKSTKANENITLVNNSIEKLEITIADIEKELLKRVQVEENIKQITEDLDSERDNFNTLNVSKSKIETLKSINDKIIKLLGLINSIGLDKTEEEQRINKLKKDILGKEKELSELKVVSGDEIDKLELELNAVNNDMLDYSEKFRDSEKKLADAKHLLKVVEDRGKRLRAGTCFECQQEVTHEYINKKHEEISEEVKKYIKEVAAHIEDRDENSKKLHEVNSVISNLSDKINQLRNLKNSYETNKILFTESIKGFKATLELSEKNFEKLTRTLDDAVSEKNELDVKCGILQKEIPERIDQKIIFAEQNIKNLEITLSTLNVELGKLGQLENTKKEHESILKDKKKELKESKKDAYIYDTLTRKYKDYARRKFEDSIVSIQNVANGIIHQIIPNLSVKIYEDDSKLKRLIIGFDVNGKDRSYKRLSGGQRVIVNIALRLGFSKIIQARAKSNIGFVVLDEPFGFLDEKNRELVSRMLTVMLKWFEQILVISHVDNIKDFPNVVNVGMTANGVSYIK